jgi:integrase
MFDKNKLNTILSKIKAEKPGYFETLRNNLPVFCKLINDDEPVKELIVTFKKFPKIKNVRDLARKDMITWEEGLEMAEKTNSAQVKAIILTQLDAGLRPSEFVDLKFGDVERNDDFIILHVNGKTGKRDVPCWRCVPYLMRWLHDHPTKKAEDPLWLQEQYTNGKIKKYEYAAMLRRVNQCSIDKWGYTTKLYQRTERGKKLPKKIPKRKLDFYLLRHSSCFLDKMDNIPIDTAAERHGHSIDFFKNVYGRLDVTDTISRIKKHYGGEEEKKTIQKNITCTRCDFINEPGVEICSKCGAALTLKKAFEMEKNEKDQIKELKEVLLKRLESLETKAKEFGIKI